MTQLHHPIQFQSLSPERYANALKQQLDHTQKVIENITTETISTYEAVCGALDDALSELQSIFHIGQHLEGIVGGAEWRATMGKLRPTVTRLLTSVPLNAELHRLQHVETTNSTLPPLQRRHLELTLDTFRQGALLDPEDKEALRDVELRLSEMTSKFAQNAIDATESIAIECPVMDLSGLPESHLRRYRTRQVGWQDGRNHCWRRRQRNKYVAIRALSQSTTKGMVCSFITS